MQFVPPPWFPIADRQKLAVAADDYVRDASAALSGWLPRPAAQGAFGLRIVLLKPMPLFHDARVPDRQHELGLAPGTPWTQEEVDCANRGWM